MGAMEFQQGDGFRGWCYRFLLAASVGVLLAGNGCSSSSAAASSTSTTTTTTTTTTTSVYPAAYKAAFASYAGSTTATVTYPAPAR